MAVPVRAPLILFDGVCNLCNAWVRFVIRRDPTGVFRFAAQQSPVGQAVIEGHVRGTGQLSSIVLIADGWVYTESGRHPPDLLRASVRRGHGSRYCGSFLVEL